uniref:Sushi, von Willebrand factor type A, EGF and pentraxin domain-containing protein 1 n=1 Tax=Octopus bimaculoides TaxID=37653 RepID=A0A0L8FVA6_OCTBM
MTTRLIRVHQAHASQPYVRDMVISYQDKQRMTSQVGSHSILLSAEANPKKLTPQLPAGVLPNTDQCWHIKASSAPVINLKIQILEFKAGTSGYMFISFGNISDIVANFTSLDMTTLLISNSKDVHVCLHTNTGEQQGDFVLYYSEGCDIQLESNLVSISSPGYNWIEPNNSVTAKNVRCKWTVPEYKVYNRRFGLIIQDVYRVNNETLVVTYEDKSASAIGDNVSIILSGNSVVDIQFKSLASGTNERFSALVAADCPSLENTVFTRLPGDSTDKKFTEFGSTVQATCKPGYSFNQTNAQNTQMIITCLIGGYWNVSQHCQRVICGDAPVVANGFVASSSGVKYGSMAYYKCVNGFLINGLTIALCQTNGQWSKAPTCSKATCPAIPNTPHLTIDASDANRYNSVVNFSCASGYTVDGSIKIFCGMDGKWSKPIPTCKEIKCVVPITSYFNTPDKVVPYQSVIVFKCPKGFVIENLNKSTTGVICNERGTFGSPPKCEDYNECQANPCKQNEVCSNTEGSHRCDCRKGFHRVNGVCTDIDECSTGMHLCEQICKNTQGSYQCECQEGYTKHSVDITEFINNTHIINQMAVYCKKIRCPTPMIPNTGNNIISPRQHYFYNDKVKYSCNFGYVVSGTDTIICTSSGTWSYRPACTRM